MSVYFGDPWPSGICEDPESMQIPTPVGKPCIHCGELITEGEQGTMYSNSPFAHRECSLRAVLGSVAHLEKRCSCYVPGSTENDDEGLTPRQAAIAAWEWVQKHGMFEEE